MATKFGPVRLISTKKSRTFVPVLNRARASTARTGTIVGLEARGSPMPKETGKSSAVAMASDQPALTAGWTSPIVRRVTMIATA